VPSNKNKGVPPSPFSSGRDRIMTPEERRALAKTSLPADVSVIGRTKAVLKPAEEDHSARVVDIKISKLRPFKGQPIQPYTGKRKDDLVNSIKEHGMMQPIIVRPLEDDICEVLIGHNRLDAAAIAKIDEVSCIIKEGMTDDEALYFFIHSNLCQKAFSEYLPSEKAAILGLLYDSMKRQGKRTDLFKELEMLSNPDDIKENSTCCQVGEKLNEKTNKKVGDAYDTSPRTISRLLRLRELIPELLERLDNKEIGLVPTVSLSFLRKQEQQDLEGLLAEGEGKFNVDIDKADELKTCSESGHLSIDKIYEILTSKKGTAVVRVSQKIINKYFAQDQKPAEINRHLDKALGLYQGIESCKSLDDAIGICKMYLDPKILGVRRTN